MKSLKILYSISDVNGCSFYRMFVPASVMRRSGYDARITNLSDKEIFADDEDICIIQRQYLPEAFEAIIRKRKKGIKIVGELDDNFWNIPKENSNRLAYDSEFIKQQESEARARGELKEDQHFLDTKHFLTEFVKMCDAMIVSTYPLANVVKDFNKYTYVSYNYLADDLFFHINPPLKIEPNKPVRILWTGSPTHGGDMPFAIEAIRNLIRKGRNIKFVILGLPPVEMGSEFVLDDTFELHNPITPVPSYYYYLQSIPAHIGIAPLAKNPFNNCKSWIKGLEYGMCGYCPLLQKSNPYSSLAYELGYKIPLVEKNTVTAWEKSLEFLIDNPDFTYNMAVKFQKDIITRFAAINNIKNYENLYNRILELPYNTYMPKILPMREAPPKINKI
jgi:glycosyltransferase involved in cell wall biosynthesis